MKRFLTLSASLALTLSIVAPTFAAAMDGRITRRSLRNESTLSQRIVPGTDSAIPIALRLRRQPEKDATGRMHLERAILRMHGVRGVETSEPKPTRRAIMNGTVLPPVIIETGQRMATERPSRRSVMLRARLANFVVIPPLAAPTIVEEK